MNESIIQRVTRRSNRQLLALSLLGLVLAAGLGILNLRYFYNFFLGPFEATPDEIISASSAAAPQNYWVNIRGEELLNTGIQYVTTRDSGEETVDASYYALLLGERLLLVKLEGNLAADTLDPYLTGWLENISGEEKTEILQEIETEVPELVDVFLPFKLNTGNFRTGGIVGLIAGAVVVGLSLWGLLLVIRRNSDPASHPVLKALERFGPLDFVTSRIEAEMAGEHQKIGKLNLTSNWMVYEDQANLKATRYEDVTWIYKHITTQRYYGIPISKTFTTMVYDRHGAQLQLVGGRKEQPTDEMLRAIAGRAPWAVMGYSNELDQTWKKDRAEFLAAVDRRKSEVQLQPA